MQNKSEFSPEALTGEIKKHYEADDLDSIFTARVPVVNYKNPEDLASTIKGNFFTADMSCTDALEFTQDTVGSFEFVQTSIPRIKIVASVRNDPAIIAKGIKQRVNSLLLSFMYGGKKFYRNGLGIELELDVPKEFHSKAKEDENPVEVIKRKLADIENLYGVTYDRITLNRSMLAKIAGSISSLAGNLSSEVADGPITLLDLDVDIYDRTYLERNHDGTTARYKYIPDNTVLFSNTCNDKNPDVFHFGNTVCSPSSDIHENLGPLCYIEERTVQGNTQNFIVGLVCGVPVLKDVQAFASVVFE